MKADNKLTLIVKLKICWNVLTTKEKHNHSAQIKNIELFQLGYSYGFKDAMPKLKENRSINLHTKS